MKCSVVLWALALALSAQTAHAACGDGVFEIETEVCDDGNLVDGDGCDAVCDLECEEVGYRATEHTCLHGSFGPFASVGATPRSEAVVQSSVSTSHTYYTVTLPGNPGDNFSRVTYEPGPSDTVSVYLKKPYLMRLIDEHGSEVPVILENPVDSCADADSLTWVRVYRPVVPGATYIMELGPSEETTMSMAFETMGYTGPHYLDRDHDGLGAGEIAATSWCTPPLGFAYEKGDCDDEDPDTFPGAPELCDGKNTDCDALLDDKEKTLCAGQEAGHICIEDVEEWRCGCANEAACSEGLVCGSNHSCVAPESPNDGSGGTSGEPDDHEPEKDPMGGSGSKPDDDESPDDDDDDDDEPEESGSDSEKDPQDMIDDGHEDDRGCTYSPLPSGLGGIAHGLGGLLLLSMMLARRTRGRTEVRKGMAMLAGLLALALPSQARAELPPDCVDLGKALVEHSCFHSEFGPFEYRIPTKGAQANADTPNVDPVHTEYRLILAPGENAVTYTPARAGSFSMFTGWDVPLSVAWPEGEIPELFRMEETGCDALPLSRVFELEAHEIYTLTFETSEPTEVVLVIEYIDDFSVKNGLDQDGDGYGDPDNTVTTSCVPPAGYAPNTSDCDDTNPLIHPAAAELCGDAIDQNCNGLPDDTGFSCRLGAGACLVEGTMVCGDDGQAACAATLVEGTPEECNGRDDDCDGEIDEEDGLCPDAQAPRCVRFQLAASCGCQFDSDCAASGDGHVCDAATGTCQKEPEEPDEGMGGMSNEGSGGRTEPSDPSGGRTNDDDETDEEEPDPRPIDESGCGCRTHGRSPWGGGSATVMLLGIGWFLRRRSRGLAHGRRASA